MLVVLIDADVVIGCCYDFKDGSCRVKKVLNINAFGTSVMLISFVYVMYEVPRCKEHFDDVSVGI